MITSQKKNHIVYWTKSPCWRSALYECFLVHEIFLLFKFIYENSLIFQIDICIITGGHVIIVMREEYLVYVEEYYNRLEPYMKELQEAGKWKLIERSASLKDYALGKDGITFVFSVLECGYKKFTSVVLRE